MLGKIEAFLEVVRTGNMHRAAESLSVSQPTLSSWIRSLEVELGTRLFRRGRQGMTLTASGRAFIPNAQRAVESIRGGAALLRDIERGLVGEVSIGAERTIATYVLPHLASSLASSHPRVRLVVRTGRPEEVADAVLGGEVAIGLIPGSSDLGLKAWPIYEEELILVSHPEHHAAELGHVNVIDVQEARFVTLSRRSAYYTSIANVFEGAEIEPRIVLEVDSVESAVQMVILGVGLAWLPSAAVDAPIADGSLHRIAVAGAPPARCRSYALVRANFRESSAAMDTFSQLLQEVANRVPGTYPVTADQAYD